MGGRTDQPSRYARHPFVAAPKIFSNLPAFCDSAGCILVLFCWDRILSLVWALVCRTRFLVLYSRRFPPFHGTMSGQTAPLLSTLLSWIDLGRLNPGDVIDEAPLVAEFGISRTPVREALLQLEAMGLIRRLPRKGAVVFRPTLEEFLAILEVHARLEAQAAGLAARRLSKSGAVALEATVKACEAHAKRGDADPDGYYQLNLAFHATVADAAGNPFLTEMIKTNARKLLAYYRARYRYAGSIVASAREHRQLAGLITSGDTAGAEALMQRHVQFDQVTAMDLLAALA
jgi:DNA-binding GntR family transcriptional regulator